MAGSGQRPRIELLSPLAGWALPLSEVPDPVFAQGLAGDGVAIDPGGEVLHAPCDGDLVLPGKAQHAVMVRGACGDVLMHVGIDTVKLGGEGFRLLARGGERVRAGQPLLEFDLALIARRAPSAITPVLLGGEGAARVVARTAGQRVAVGDPLLVLEPGEIPGHPAGTSATATRRTFRITHEHGLHARPSAQLVAALAGIDAEVTVHARGRSASARSTVGLMSLGVQREDRVEVAVAGPGTMAAWAVLERQLGLPLAAAREPRAEGATSISGRHRAPVAPPRPGDRIAARVASAGLAEGTAYAWAESEGEAVSRAPSADPPAERARLDAAIGRVKDHLARLAARAEGAARGLMGAHQVLLEDPEVRGHATRLIAAGQSAEQAWSEATAEAARALAEAGDERMAERRADLKDLRQQVLRVLSGHEPDVAASLPPHSIVVAQELLPSQFLALDHAHLAGVCMAGGGASSHVAILAAARGIPMLVGAGANVLAIATGTPLVLDGEQGELLVDPPAAERERHSRRRARRAARRAADLAQAQQPALTRDGHRIAVYCNLGALADAAPAVANGAEGCGLLRTEFLFLDRQLAPTVAEQRAEYQGIASALAGRPLTIRTLDAGGDKPIAYLPPQPREENPALGLRGLRTSLAHRELLVAQLEAILAVQPAGQCRILLPMVTDLADVRTVRTLLESLVQGTGRAVPPLGVMIETPSAALLADQLCREVEFLSIGSNDLSQYALAIDRQHALLGGRLDALHPAVLRLMAMAAQAARTHGREVGLCGALASDPLAVPVLIGLGVHELSATPAQVPAVKGRVRELELAACERLAAELLQLPDAPAVRAHVRAWLARQPGIEPGD